MARLRDPAYRKAVDALVERRKAISMKQGELAEALGKPQSFVSKFENYERRLDAAEYIMIAKALGLKGRALLKALGVE